VTAAQHARGVLWRWTQMLREETDGAWGRAELVGAIEAAERTCALPADELGAWRSVAADAPIPTPAGHHDRIAAHLELLLGRVQPLERETPPDRRDGMDVFTGAVDALHETGLLDDAAHDAWRGRAIRAWTPWLDEEAVEKVVHADLVAISVPPSTPDEEAEDERRRAEHAELIRRGDVVRVLVATGVVRDEEQVAVTAAVARTDSTELHFHALGPPQVDDLDDRPLSDRLPLPEHPPELSDDVGTRYRPVHSRPVGAGSHGSRPGVPTVVTGQWRYQPAMPVEAAVLTATSGDTVWTLRSGEATI
jgi:predicted nuclease with RNAse H fold